MDLETYLKEPLPFYDEINRYLDPSAPITIFEIGSCEGEDTIKLRGKFPNASIYCFEPLQKNITRFKNHLKKYQAEGPKVFKLALSNKNGEATFHVSSGQPDHLPKTKDWDYGNKSSSLFPPKEHTKTHEWIKFDFKQKVKTQRLDSFCEQQNVHKVDFIYMDVQGAELMVLEGAGRKLRDVTAIWLEVEAIELYAKQPIKKDVEAFMKKNGFSCLKSTVDAISGDQLYINNRVLRRIKPSLIRRGGSKIKRAARKLHALSGRRYTQPLLLDDPSLTVGTTNLSVRESWLEKTLKKITKGKHILDAGAGELQYKRFCKHLKYTAQDFGGYDGQGNVQGLQMETWDNSKLDMVSDIASIPVKDRSFDAIMCIEVFEHIPHPTEAIKEFSRIIKKGGKLVITTPVSSLTHFAPFYFYNGYSRYYFEKLLPEQGFKIKEIAYNGNFFEYLAQELRRIDQVTETYADTALSLTPKERAARTTLLTKLQKLSETGNASSEILSLGIMVVAEKI